MADDILRSWLAGSDIPGVAYAYNTPVRILEGDEAGETGSIVSIRALAPETIYIVELGSGAGDVVVAQSALQALA